MVNVPCVLMFPEDLGGHAHSGPSSPWALQDWRHLEGLGEAKRGSAFLCRLADADHRRPTGFITNPDTLISDLHLGWPSLLPIQQDLYYDGPLPKACPCTTQHSVLVGLDPAHDFLSGSCPVIPVYCFQSFFQLRSTSSLRVEVPIPSSAAPSGSSTATARLSDAPVSWSWLCGLWQSGRLTRLALADVADSAQVHRYFSFAPSASLVSPRSRLAEFLSVVSVGLPSRVPASGPLACVSPASLPVPGLLSAPTRAHFRLSEIPRREGFDEHSARIDTDAHSLNSVLPASTDSNDHDAAPRKVQRTGSANWATGSGELSTDGIFDSGPPASSPPGFLASGSAVFGVGTGFFEYLTSVSRKYEIAPGSFGPEGT